MINSQVGIVFGGSGNNDSDNCTICSSLLWLFSLTFILPFEIQALIYILSVYFLKQ